MPFTKGTKRGARESRSDSDEDEVLTKPTKKTKTSKAAAEAGSASVDKEGNPFWDLSNKRRIGLSQFKGTTLVNIREFYEKDGNMLPGKKGISLSVAQYEALVKAIPAINAKLGAMGHEIEDVEDGAATPTAVESHKPTKKEKKSKAKSKKSNIEATSDEESGSDLD